VSSQYGREGGGGVAERPRVGGGAGSPVRAIRTRWMPPPPPSPEAVRGGGDFPSAGGGVAVPAAGEEEVEGDARAARDAGGAGAPDGGEE